METNVEENKMFPAFCLDLLCHNGLQAENSEVLQDKILIRVSISEKFLLGVVSLTLPISNYASSSLSHIKYMAILSYIVPPLLRLYPYRDLVSTLVWLVLRVARLITFPSLTHTLSLHAPP